MVTQDTPTLPPSFAARRFDGRSALAKEVRFTIEGGDLAFEAQPGGPVEHHALADIAVAEPLSHAPRILRLADGGLLQVEESPALAAALARAGVRHSPVVRWQRAWPASLIALVLLVAASAWLYFDGLPRVADWAARHISPSLEAHMGDQTLAALDRSALVPSTLPAFRQAELTQRFVAFQKAAGLEQTRRIVFRAVRSGAGINAFALPGGVIVFLDGIVEMTSKDDEMLLAVLAHESGHQQMHHMTRSLFRGLGGAALAGLLWGDYSSVASHAAILFGQLRYSREDESEADEFALAALARAGISPGALARLFFEEDARANGKGRVELEWLSTHPGDRDRAERALEAAEAYRARAASAAPR
jgi:predicted Zn-dependent protease